MQRFIEHYDHVDVEENFNGIWAVIRCNIVLSKSPKERSATKPPVQKAPKAYYERNKEKIQARHAEYRKSFPSAIKGSSIYSKYGMSQDDYDNLKAIQNNKCALCGDEPEDKIRKSLVVDHCHKNKKVRGLLCNKCNVALGLFRDRIDVLKNAIEYLQKHS